MTFNATYDNVVIKLIKEEKASLGGIVLSGSVDKTHNKGLVKFIGQGRKNKEGNIVPLSVKVGDTVLFGLNIGIKISIDNEEYLVVKEGEIFGVED